MKLNKFNDQIDKEIDQIDKEIEALNKRKNDLLKSKNKSQTNVIDRINNLCSMDWEEDSCVQDPFSEMFFNDFKSKEGLTNSVIIDDYTIFRMDYDRHQSMSISDIAESILDDVENDLSKEINVLYDRMSKKYYKVTAQDALEALEKWAIENEIHSWEIDW